MFEAKFYDDSRDTCYAGELENNAIDLGVNRDNLSRGSLSKAGRKLRE